MQKRKCAAYSYECIKCIVYLQIDSKVQVKTIKKIKSEMFDIPTYLNHLLFERVAACL